MYPLREEMSSIKLWPARVTNHLERAKLDGDLMRDSKMAELLGPCSRVGHSPTPMILAYLVGEWHTR